MNGTTAALLVIALTAPLGGAVKGTDSRGGTECREASVWAATKARSFTPRLGEWVTFSAAQRRALYDRIPDADRRALWAEQFALVLAIDRGLTDQQRSVLVGVQQRLDQLLAPDVGEQLRSELAVSAKRAFGLEKARSVFADLGGPWVATLARARTNSAVILSSTSPARGPVLELLRVGTAPVDCSCSARSDWCGNQSRCEEGSCRHNQGCGTLWFYTCTGMCYSGNQT